MKLKTIGLSPKVTWPTVALVALGAVLVVIGVVVPNTVVTDLGIGVLGASGVSAPLGWLAPPGKVVEVPNGGTGTR